MDIDNRYWAGFFDGEGNIYFSKDLVHMCVNVTQKETAILYALRHRFGGGITKSDKRCNRWYVVGAKKMQAFLEAIAPHSIIKAVEIRVALDIITGIGKGQYNRGYNGGQKLPEIERVRRQELRDTMMADRMDAKQIKAS